jgi:hypothetical protein
VLRDKARQAFVGHIGGDDFFFLADLSSFEESCCQEASRGSTTCIGELLQGRAPPGGYIGRPSAARANPCATR